MPKFTFDHIHLRTPDPEGTAAYYERMFGAELSRSSADGKPRIDVLLGGQTFFVSPITPGIGAGEPPTAPYQGLEHIGLTVTGIDEIAAELKAKGAEFTLEPTTIRPGTRIAFIRGPQNVSIELVDRTAA